jgi:hypothetical protein
MEYLEGEILKKQGEAKVIAWPSAFITFSTRAAQVWCVHAQLHFSVYQSSHAVVCVSDIGHSSTVLSL